MLLLRENRKQPHVRVTIKRKAHVRWFSVERTWQLREPLRVVHDWGQPLELNITCSPGPAADAGIFVLQASRHARLVKNRLVIVAVGCPAVRSEPLRPDGKELALAVAVHEIRASG